jgi:hypothetical protein
MPSSFVLSLSYACVIGIIHLTRRSVAMDQSSIHGIILNMFRIRFETEQTRGTNVVPKRRKSVYELGMCFQTVACAWYIHVHEIRYKHRDTGNQTFLVLF